MTIASFLILLAPAVDTVTGTVSINGRPAKESVVWLQNAGTAKPISASVVQKGKEFLPHIMVVPVGSTVDFPNRDDLFHNVFAEYKAKKFDLGMYPKGKSKMVTFDKPGPVSLLCNMHSSMSAYIMVVNSAYYAKSDRSGKFSLSGVPDGSYEICAWHESGAKGSKKITISGGNSTVVLDLKR